MIDHEFRIITPILKKLILKRLSSEKILNKKIPKNIFKNRLFIKHQENYLKKAKLIKKIFFRGLPINSKKEYFIQEDQLADAFNSYINNYRLKITGKQIIQIPNPDLVEFTEFKKRVEKINNFHGFELISSWHNKQSNDSKYFKFLQFVSDLRLPLSLEVDYIYRQSKNSIANFFYLSQKFNKIRFWLPHLGCGVFLHWDLIKNNCKYAPKLLTSTKNFFSWGKILKAISFEKRNMHYASDHPFNDFQSYNIYKDWIKFTKKK